ncbi:MAG: sigma-70 family RNA polymerase sigma factor [Ruminococcus sp.]|nr:sigma-70 family RNA polymerase sigma factor [Ruminococcus sp.]
MDEVQFLSMSYEQVVRKYKKTIGSVCVMRLKNWADAEDCFQNTFLKLYKNPPDFSDEEHLKAWLIRVAINECNRYIRKNRFHLSLDDIRDEGIDFPEESCDMSWALMELEPKYREVLYLHYCEVYQINEIAQILNKSPNTIKTLLRRGREKLRKIYGGDGI